jgi:hypothetical protein
VAKLKRGAWEISRKCNKVFAVSLVRGFRGDVKPSNKNYLGKPAFKRRLFQRAAALHQLQIKGDTPWTGCNS